MVAIHGDGLTKETPKVAFQGEVTEDLLPTSELKVTMIMIDNECDTMLVGEGVECCINYTPKRLMKLELLWDLG